ncbi:hypothetical protein B9Z19DRAFT_1066336 [Tuber borchii]|uniref:Uncharacterized protein n=1 Tax=Tuber borchii TaxID=42251 RepID=A0A2T6ZMS9_TUBBO|nr:hypothetical protein B9Z19DRAFT_1066336 [Tuber borchii]
MWTYFLLPALLLLQSIAVQAHPPSLTKTTLSPRDFWDWFFGTDLIGLKGFNQDGCQTASDFDLSISGGASCRTVSSTGVTNVVVVANDKLPSTCILTLYEDKDCKGDSYAQIGPIAPTSNPSACIGPIKNPAGALFRAKAAAMKC